MSKASSLYRCLSKTMFSTKELLKASTQELVDRGGFGSPTIFLNKTNMFFGNDRLDLLEKILKNYS